MCGTLHPKPITNRNFSSFEFDPIVLFFSVTVNLFQFATYQITAFKVKGCQVTIIFGDESGIHVVHPGCIGLYTDSFGQST